MTMFDYFIDSASIYRQSKRTGKVARFIPLARAENGAVASKYFIEAVPARARSATPEAADWQGAVRELARAWRPGGGPDCWSLHLGTGRNSSQLVVAGGHAMVIDRSVMLHARVPSGVSAAALHLWARVASLAFAENWAARSLPESARSNILAWDALALAIPSGMSLPAAAEAAMRRDRYDMGGVSPFVEAVTLSATGAALAAVRVHNWPAVSLASSGRVNPRFSSHALEDAIKAASYAVGDSSIRHFGVRRSGSSAVLTNEGGRGLLGGPKAVLVWKMPNNRCGVLARGWLHTVTAPWEVLADALEAKFCLAGEDELTS